MKTIRASAFLACVLVLSGNLSYAAPAVTLYFEGNGQVELISSKGTRVPIDMMGHHGPFEPVQPCHKE